MNRNILPLFYFITTFFTYFIILPIDMVRSERVNNDRIAEDLIIVFKRSMQHWNLDYDSLPENKSGAACIPLKEINQEYLSNQIFEALGYGFNLYDEKIGKKAALEGCERMKKYYKLQEHCNCEMILFNNESRIKVPINKE